MVPSYTLSNGVTIPQIAFGTWKHDDTAATTEIVKLALKIGYRHIDTAAFYRNEFAVGRAIRESEVDRREIFLTNKVWNTRRGYDAVLFDFDRMLQTMGLDYIDLLLVHWPAARNFYENWEKINSDTWRGFERLYEEGRVRAIGVSNFLPHHIESLRENNLYLPMVNQIKFHPGITQPAVYDYCTQHHIRITAYTPLGKGKVLTSPELSAIGKKYGKSPAQITLRWSLHHGVIPLPKSSSESRMKENLDIFDFSLTQEEIDFLDSLETEDTALRDPDAIDLV